MMKELIIAIEEEIGNPGLFVGRRKELNYFLDWTEKVKKELSHSTAILSRKKRGKTALVQRLCNILHTQNDPMLIPFYFKIEEGKISQLNFSDIFYRSLLSQYLGFKFRNINFSSAILPFNMLEELAKNDKTLLPDISGMEQIIEKNNPDLAWKHAREAGHRISALKGERIIQVIDEFQFLNEYIYTDNTHTNRIELATFYQSTAESKVSPQIITGSYIGWLSTIIGKMVSRYDEYYLENFTDEEALEAVYNYSNIYEEEVSYESACYMTGVCENDPYYIARMFESRYEGKDLTSIPSIIETLKYETTYPTGRIAKMWLEYIWDAIEKVNDKNAKKIILYLAKYGEEERTREQILKDLNLDMDDDELETKLHKLAKADIIAYGSTNYDFKGLGDNIFEIVFRKMYEKEIEKVDVKIIEEEINKQLLSIQKQISYFKGMAAEYRIINRLLFAEIKKIPLENIVYNHQEGMVLGRFASMKKRLFHIDQERGLEADIFCESEDKKGTDFVVEVKDWKDVVSTEKVKQFIEKKKLLEVYLTKSTGYIFYSENGLTKEQEELLAADGIMYTDAGRLSYLS